MSFSMIGLEMCVNLPAMAVWEAEVVMNSFPDLSSCQSRENVNEVE